MKLRKALALGLAAAMTVSMIGCGSTADTSTDTADTTEAAKKRQKLLILQKKAQKVQTQQQMAFPDIWTSILMITQI